MNRKNKSWNRKTVRVKLAENYNDFKLPFG